MQNDNEDYIRANQRNFDERVKYTSDKTEIVSVTFSSSFPQSTKLVKVTGEEKDALLELQMRYVTLARALEKLGKGHRLYELAKRVSERSAVSIPTLYL